MLYSQRTKNRRHTMPKPKRPVIILHGWSDDSSSFEGLAKWLKGKGFNVVDIFLGDYLSMHNEITLSDLGFAFKNALLKRKISEAPHSFDLIVHSTGALVAREYLRQVCITNGKRDASLTPIRNLCFLAPANFGSPLAAKGKSVAGRIIKGWSWERLFKEPEKLGQTGQRILDALELAAPYTWQLGLDDLFDPAFPIFSPQHVRATVMVGSAPYTSIARFTHEAGSDGTVRVSAASLNAHYYALDFADPDKPAISACPRNSSGIALAVFNRNHGNIYKTPNDEDGLDQTAEWEATILRALSVDAAGYQSHLTACDTLTATTFAAHAADAKDPENFHRYMHVIFRVHDQFGDPIPDYVIDFYQPNGDPKDKIYGEIHSKILEKVTTHSLAPHFRSFLFDITDLEEFLAKTPGSDIQLSIAAAPISGNIGYRNPSPSPNTHGVPVFTSAADRFIHPNDPVLVDITLYRDPADAVFKLNKA